MKKILLFKFIFIILVVQAQQEDITLDQLLINSGSYNKSSLNSRTLYQRSIMYADIPRFNSGNNIADYKYFEQALLEMYLSTDKNHFVSTNTLREYILPELYSDNLVNVGILNTELEILNYDTENPSSTNNGFTFTGTSLIPISDKTQFVTFRNSIISPLKKNLLGTGTIKFRFRNDLWFNNSSNLIKNLVADLGDGVLRDIIVNGI